MATATSSSSSGGDVASKKPFRLDPTLTMSSTTANNAESDAAAVSRSAFPRRKSTDSSHSRRSVSSATSTATAEPRRAHRSSDRLHRVGGSNARLSNAHRTKSQTLLATEGKKTSTGSTTGVAGAGAVSKGKSRADSRDEDGWDSLSHTSASSESRANSPARSYGDEGLVMMSKKKDKIKQAADVHPETSAGAPVPQRMEAPPSDLPPSSTLALSTPSEILPTASSPPAPSEAQTKAQILAAREREAASSPLSNADSQETLPVEAHAGRLPGKDDEYLNRERSYAGERSYAATRSPASDVGSSSNLQTLRSPVGEGSGHVAPHSPGSTRSRSSLANRTYSHAYAPAVAPPKLDTHNALVGALGALHEDRATTPGEMTGPYSSSPGESRTGTSSKRYSLDLERSRGSATELGWGSEDVPGGTAGSNSSTIIVPGSIRRRNPSGASMSNINIGLSGPVVGGVSRAAVTRHGSDASSHATDLPRESGHHANSSDTGRFDRIRKLSTQSLTAADAAKLASRLRANREGTDDGWINRSSATAALSRAGSAVGLNKLTGGPAGAAKTLSRTQTMPLSGFVGVGGSGSGSGAGGSAAAEHYYVKPVVSTFARTVGGADRTAPEAVIVREGSVFSESFGEARAVVEQDGDHRKGKGRSTASRGRHSRGGSGGSATPLVRYVLPYGLSGPPFVRTALNDSILAPSFSTDEFDASWAPALANAAGLGTRARRHTSAPASDGVGPGLNSDSSTGLARTSARSSTAADLAVMEMSMLLPEQGQASGTALANGPNAVPLHIVHGLTSISDKAFPLDGSELPAGLPSFGPGVHPADLPATDDEGSLLVPHAALRALALTSCALAVARAHTVTRRFADPMRCSLERVARDSARNGGFAASVARDGSSSALPPTSPAATWGGSSGHSADFRRSQSEANTRPQANQYHAHRPSQPSTPGISSGSLSRTTSTASAASSNSAEPPLQSLKRVWSGGAARGGLAALTRTDEGAERP